MEKVDWECIRKENLWLLEKSQGVAGKMPE